MTPPASAGSSPARAEEREPERRSGPRKVQFVTGTLAAPLLHETLAEMEAPFEYDVAVLGISVAALMTTEWVARFLKVAPGADLILLPGYAQGEMDLLEGRFGVRAERGPKDLRQIPEHFGMAAARAEYGAHDIQILAEINLQIGRFLLV